MEKNFIYGQMKAPGKKKATCDVEATCEKEKISHFNNDFLINNYHSEQVKKGTGVRTDYVFKYLTIDEYLENAKEIFENEDKRDMEKYLIGKFSDSALAAELAEVKASKINAGRQARAYAIYERNKSIFDSVEKIISQLKVNDMFTLETFNNTFKNVIGNHPRIVSTKLEMLVENGKLRTEKRRITTGSGNIVRKVYIIAK